MIKISDYD